MAAAEAFEIAYLRLQPWPPSSGCSFRYSGCVGKSLSGPSASRSRWRVGPVWM
jgi:hypothetical protein